MEAGGLLLPAYPSSNLKSEAFWIKPFQVFFRINE